MRNRSAYVGRTLLSAAFDSDFFLKDQLPKFQGETNVKSGGQECPPHTTLNPHGSYSHLAVHEQQYSSSFELF
jgi:hypothetical protein